MSNGSLDYTRVYHSLREANAAYRDFPSLVRSRFIALPHGFMLYVGRDMLKPIFFSRKYLTKLSCAALDKRRLILIHALTTYFGGYAGWLRYGVSAGAKPVQAHDLHKGVSHV